MSTDSAGNLAITVFNSHIMRLGDKLMLGNSETGIHQLAEDYFSEGLTALETVLSAVQYVVNSDGSDESHRVYKVILRPAELAQLVWEGIIHPMRIREERSEAGYIVLHCGHISVRTDKNPDHEVFVECVSTETFAVIDEGPFDSVVPFYGIDENYARATDYRGLYWKTQ